MNKIHKQRVQEFMWVAFSAGEEGLHSFADALALAGADPDNKVAKTTADQTVPTVLNQIFQGALHDRSDELNALTIKLAVLNGADIGFNRANIRNFDACMASHMPQSTAILLAEMAAYDLEHKGYFELPIDDAFAKCGAPYPDARTDVIRDELAYNIQRNQHAFVDYVETSDMPSALYLRQNYDHESFMEWTMKIEEPKQEEYSRPHPNFFLYFNHMAQIAARIEQAQDMVRAGRDGAKSLLQIECLDADFSKRQSKDILMSWKPKLG